MTEKPFPTSARVVIVGGGVMGAGLLYHLAEEGWSDCLLVEKGELTSGSTWHAAGLCPNFIADYNMAKIHNYGVKLYPRLEEITGQYVSWHDCGSIRFALKPAEVEWFQRVAAVGKLVGFDCEIIDKEKIKQLNPHVVPDGVLAGAWTTGDGHVDPAGVCNAMAKGARNMGASVVTNTRVTDIKQRASGEWEVVTERGTVMCEMVVNAAGCYARQVSQMVGTDIPITNMKHTYVVTDAVPEFVADDGEMAVIRDPYASSYYRQEQKSALIGIYETVDSEECWTHRGGWPEWDSQNELFDPNFDTLTPFIERVMERMPAWSQLGIKRVVCGAIPHTPDANPLLGPAAGLHNFWHCNGASIGIAAGAGSGKYLAQWMVYGDSEINMSGVDPRRFGKYAPGDYTKAKSHQDYEHMYALHLPGEERPASREQRVTPLYAQLKKAGAVYTEANGWERPKWFSLDGREEEVGFRHNNVMEVVAEECRAVRERVGVLDLSSFAKYEVTGADAEAFLNRISANRMPRRNGGIALTHYLSADGRIQGESTVTRLSDENFYTLTPFIERVMERMPAWSELGIKRVVCGAIPHTPDANPLLGPAAGLHNFWHCNGASIGIAAGAGSGKYLAQWMVYGDSEINMSGVDPRRFGKYAPGDYTKAKSHQDYEHMYALHLPGEERPASREERVTPLYAQLKKAGAVYTEANGWERPKWFSLDGREEEVGFRHNNVMEVVAEECRAVRERVGVLDLSSFAKYEITGADAESLLNRISANRMPRRDGGIALTHYLSADGRIQGESTVTRLSGEHFYILSGAGAEDRDLDWINHSVKSGEKVTVANVTDDIGVLVIAGPNSRDTLAGLTDADLSNESFRWLTAQEIKIADIPLRAIRVNYVGELGWELHCPMTRLADLYAAVWKAGAAHGIANFGVYAVNSLRMEKAYKGWGAELTNEITPIEADIMRFFAEGKDDFVGKQATLDVRENGAVQKLVYLTVTTADCDIAGGEPVFADGKPIGVTTSGGYGHHTQTSLGFAYVAEKFSAVGTELTVELLGKMRTATVTADAVWDASNERLRG